MPVIAWFVARCHAYAVLGAPAWNATVVTVSGRLATMTVIVPATVRPIPRLR